MDAQDELITDFIEEAKEIIDKLDIGVVELEKNPENSKNLGNVFRAMHTLKGSSGFFALKRIEKIAHNAESVLGKMRDGHIRPNHRIINALLQVNDILRAIISALEINAAEPPGDDAPMISELVAAAQAAGSLADTAPESIASDPPNASLRGLRQGGIDASVDHVANPPIGLGDITASRGGGGSANMLEEYASPASGDPGSDAAAGFQVAAEALAPVKVSVDLIDRLMNNMSELVLARNRLLPFASRFDDKPFQSAVAAIDKLTIDLQEKILKTRMQSIGQTWGKIPRLARDVASQCQKEVVLEFSGEGTELDRAMLDVIRDPLMHIIRNSIDHGIELPATRLAMDKPRMGRVRLNAYYENSMVIIEVSDDGAGINFELIRKRAGEKKLITLEQAASMSDAQALEIIFLPGFSTSRNITNVSGRGVGMDVVKTNISSVGGTIEAVSTRGQGTTFRIKIPLTLAIMPSLFVRTADEYYAVLQNDLLELVRHRLPKIEPAFEDFCGMPVFRLRKQLVPLVFLRQLLGLAAATTVLDEHLQVVLIQAGGIRFGLVVDEILNIQELVIKPLPRLLRNTSLFSSATILGNGMVSLILDVNRIVEQTQLLTQASAAVKVQERNEALTQTAAEEVDSIRMLLFHIDGLGEAVLPLESVYRIEQIAADLVMQSGLREMVKYGDGLMQLIHLGECFPGIPAKPTALQSQLPVVVVQVHDQTIGLVVSEIHRTVDLPRKLAQTTPTQPGLLGYAFMGPKLVNVINLHEVINYSFAQKGMQALALQSA